MKTNKQYEDEIIKLNLKIKELELKLIKCSELIGQTIKIAKKMRNINL